MDAVATARGLLELTRPVNAVAAGVLTLVGAFVATADALLVAPVGAAVAATVLATGAGNAINDYFDREVDRVNDPHRPIPRGVVQPRSALAFSVALFLVAVVVALALLPPLAIAIAVVNLLALVSYTELFKGLPGVGNALVAYLGGSTFLFGGAAVGNVGPTVVLFVLAALSTFTREIIKDVEDVAGDSQEGLRTLPVAVGERRSLTLAMGLLVVAALASPLPYLLGTFGAAYLALVIPADVLMLWAGYESFARPSVGQSWLKYGMFLAAAAFVAGRAATVL
ncbi:MAG: geranylgeranylglycerol-phosphate geranylgeranyltransferase [Halorientalis sp.]